YDVIKAGIADVNGTEIASGNDTAWRQVFNYAQALAANPTVNANLYWTLQGLNPDGTRNPSLPVLVDMDNLIDFMAVIFYTGGYDTGLSQFLNNNQGNNWFGIYNHTTADQGFQFFIHDNEHSLGAQEDPVHGSQNIDRTGPFNNGNQHNYSQYNPQYLHQDLLASPEYKQRFIDEVQRLFFNDGALTVNNDIARLMERVNEVDPAVIAEAARWGDSKVTVPRNKTTWQTEINWLIQTYFPTRGTTVLNQLHGDGLYSFPAPTFSQLGGTVPLWYPLTFSNAMGVIYYTTDGSDPRLIGGAVSPTAKVFTGQIAISGNMVVKTRSLSLGSWSGIVSASFNTVEVPGDYNGSGTVDQSDYNVWRTNFGSATSLAADGNHNGVVDMADYVLWRANLGNSMSFGAAIDTSEDDLAAILARWYAEVAATPIATAAGHSSASGIVDPISARPDLLISRPFISITNAPLSAPRSEHLFTLRADESPNAQNNLLLMMGTGAQPQPTSGSTGIARESAFAQLDEDCLSDEAGLQPNLGSGTSAELLAANFGRPN
ncbi:MAG TPA: CotH kinase family protein, partial [Lacipirellulaceae bacterium]|nr:CotH kinase family protein [Lacipirellulaceae bacterium]